MEHEVFVPVSAETLRQTLRDPARVARCVPGLQQDADASAGPLSGRLKVRIGGHTITYRGALTLAERDGRFEAEAVGTEVRGTGSAKLTLTIGLTDAPGGTTVTFTGGARADGRLADLDAGTVTAAGQRLLDRFVAMLGDESASASEEPAPGEGPDPGAVPDPGAGSDPGAGADAASDSGAGSDPDADPDAASTPDADDAASVFDVEVEPPSLDGATTSGEGDFRIPDVPFEEPPAEAAHARRTMIGRSAEEVDHAPPRGRYAPVPAPDAAEGGGALRWIAPAAALALASAVVVGRALRRRK
ncbi:MULTISPECIES: SRPBCC family protein [unclassified Streptomyces]|uniref:SRPBCC family protein n=1 Tax=unclassified Streptomyces TaxID=2593676 RepID=UPI002E77C8C9|nr:SRPBCC domain-containing protein [Streptomyces sp. JV176]MEE1799818.1 SRPBCC domain-containing protein [Streptomyces sp. JV176]